jgi:hypothetical protein
MPGRARIMGNTPNAPAMAAPDEGSMGKCRGGIAAKLTGKPKTKTSRRKRVLAPTMATERSADATRVGVANPGTRYRLKIHFRF